MNLKMFAKDSGNPFPSSGRVGEEQLGRKKETPESGAWRSLPAFTAPWVFRTHYWTELQIAISFQRKLLHLVESLMKRRYPTLVRDLLFRRSPNYESFTWLRPLVIPKREGIFKNAGLTKERPVLHKIWDKIAYSHSLMMRTLCNGK